MGSGVTCANAPTEMGSPVLDNDAVRKVPANRTPRKPGASSGANRSCANICRAPSMDAIPPLAGREKAASRGCSHKQHHH